MFNNDDVSANRVSLSMTGCPQSRKEIIYKKKVGLGRGGRPPCGGSPVGGYYMFLEVRAKFGLSGTKYAHPFVVPQPEKYRIVQNNDRAGKALEWRTTKHLFLILSMGADK